jgi:hypothetical protein
MNRIVRTLSLLALAAVPCRAFQGVAMGAEPASAAPTATSAHATLGPSTPAAAPGRDESPASSAPAAGSAAPSADSAAPDDEQEKTGTATPSPASGPLSLKIDYPSEGSVLHTRQPWIRVCVTGADDAVRSSLSAILDGESITRGFRWRDNCAQWRPAEGWMGIGKRHAWSDPPYEMDGWTADMRDGNHDLEVSVSDASGKKVFATTKFRVETEHKAASLGLAFDDISLEGFDGDFAPANMIEARFGRQRIWTLARDTDVAKYTTKGITIGGISTRLADNGDPGDTETTLWRGTVGRRKGYAYLTGDSTFIAPYQGTSVLFARLDAYEGPYTAADALALEPFNDTNRVGSAFEGGIAIGISRSVTLDAGYEEMAVYPHWIFWEAAGSGLVHGLALGIADGISRQVAKTSPKTAPIVSFILRNGISYAIYHQRKSEVNWPFGGGAGLIYEGYKVSFTFTY